MNDGERPPGDDDQGNAIRDYAGDEDTFRLLHGALIAFAVADETRHTGELSMKKPVRRLCHLTASRSPSATAPTMASTTGPVSQFGVVWRKRLRRCSVQQCLQRA